MRRMRKKDRRNFGSIIKRVNCEGFVTSLVARYPHPLDPGKRITKSFRPEQDTMARAWLDQEEDYLRRCEKGLDTWRSPADREKAKANARVLFGDYVQSWIENYRTRDGKELAGSSKRNLRADVSHFLPIFANMTIQEIAPEDIKRWYDAPHPEGAFAFHRACQRLKAIFKAASTEGLDGTPALRPDNPFIFPIPPVPESDRTKVAPVTANELKTIYDAMPDYTRLSVYLAALVGGLRIGEVCGLRVGDIDLKNHLLHVRHSVNRGAEDKGTTVLSSTKTKSSMRDVVIPDELIPLIEDHIVRFCDTAAGSDAMLFRPKKTTILNQNVLRKHFDIAREKAGRPDIVFHTLRATHATMLILSGGTLREAMNALGHTSTDVAIKHYQRAVDAHTAEVANTLAVRMMPVERTREVVAGELEHAQVELKELRAKIKALKAELGNLDQASS